MPTGEFGTALGGALSIYTEGGSAVSAYGPIIGANVAVVAQTVPAILNIRSIDTTFALAGAAVGDPVLVAPPSTVSAGLTWCAFVPSAGNMTLRLSASDTTVNQVAATWGFSLIRRSFFTSIR